MVFVLVYHYRNPGLLWVLLLLRGSAQVLSVGILSLTFTNFRRFSKLALLCIRFISNTENLVRTLYEGLIFINHQKYTYAMYRNPQKSVDLSTDFDSLAKFLSPLDRINSLFGKLEDGFFLSPHTPQGRQPRVRPTCFAPCKTDFGEKSPTVLIHARFALDEIINLAARRFARNYYNLKKHMFLE